MKLSPSIQILKEQVDEGLMRCFETVSLPLAAPMKHPVTGGGKRIRPVLTMICTGVAGGNPYDAVNAGVAIEILHNFTLVHDDIMDESPLRRGRKTVHVKWNEPVGILVGDVMVGYSYNLLPNCEQHPRSKEIIKTFYDVMPYYW